ncbi:MAG: 30S ribosome-binding factor RbfA [bacterium]|nr:30S ribosome-binding factor RbfA [bacterium]
MPRRIEQLNEQLKEELANLIIKEVPLENGLITVSYVICSPDLKYAKVAISVLPEKFAGTALAGLRKHNSTFSQNLRQKLKIRQIPRFHWVLDTTESKAAEIEDIIKQIKEEGLN